jgi:hypothetical protein
VLDVEASRRASLEQATSEAEDPEEAAALRAMVEEALAGVEMEVLFAEDGTFRATMSTEEMGAHGAAGTWTIDGAAAVLTASTEDGEEQDDPESVRFALVDDRLRFEAGGPMVFVLRRR